MECLTLPIVLNINNENDFEKKKLQLIIPGEKITIYGMNREISYGIIKRRIGQLISYIDESCTLVLDFRELDLITFDQSACLIGLPVVNKIKIVVIAKEKLHRVIKRFGVEVFTPEEYIF